MKKGNSLNLAAIVKPIKRFLWKYNSTLFFVLAAGAIGLAIYSLYQVVQAASNPSNLPPTSTYTFDQATMDKIGKLKDSSASNTYTLPTDKRANPFVE